ncbi:MAG: multidrug ABC transporter ATP-binding protein [Magnetovibrio sp.]|nr:multidrug ABC transporter ATP-binding protein [Magnetovibrio sp.]|tara:strand:+ start:4156 stop:5142 length:987 start_codon:yes stop_codon:yes gene_type:complete
MRFFKPTINPDNALEVRGLRKVYTSGGKSLSKEALKGIDLTIPKGSFFALLGPNGAGKSTFINILAGLVMKTAGEAKVWGYDIIKDMRAARRCIGVVPQELNLDAFFTPREVLDLQAGLFGIPEKSRRTDEILEAVGLTDMANAYARSLSGGMRRRLLVGKAMVHSPPVLILDEPSAGVDVDLRRQLWSHVKALNSNGTTVLLTTHYLEEAEAMCDTIGIINHGQLIACENTPDLLGRLDSKQMVITVDRDLDAVPNTLAAFATEIGDSRTLQISFPPSRVNAGQVLAAINDAGLGIVDVVTREADLEDIFVNLTHADNMTGKVQASK